MGNSTSIDQDLANCRAALEKYGAITESNGKYYYRGELVTESLLLTLYNAIAPMRFFLVDSEHETAMQAVGLIEQLLPARHSKM